MEATWPQNSLGLYVHIPFCRRKCPYCDFYSVTFADQAQLQAYTERLCFEISACSEDYRGKPVDSIYFGGGTPSLLKPAQIGTVINTMASRFTLLKDLEITMEINPATVNRSSLEACKTAGINRVSLGLQSLQDKELRVLGRIHSAAAARKAITAADAAGFHNLSFDLIYGIPGQTITAWMQTLQEAVSFQPQHISIYLLQLESQVPMARAIARGELVLPAEEDIEAMYYQAIDYLHDKGIVQYEISNLALDGYLCRHNLRYWQFGEYLGFGAAAVSRLGGRRWMNAADVDAYMAGGPNRAEAAQIVLEDMEPRQQAQEAIIMGLRLTNGLNVEAFRRRFGISLLQEFRPVVERFTSSGLLELDHGWLRLTKAGLLVSNQVLCCFVE
jgi:oxygen-independent coproporphyrinogen-3 oxidase